VSDRVGRVVTALAVAYALVLSAVTIGKLVGFTAKHDLGIFAQYIWLLGHFRSPFGTIALRPMLDDHFDPTLALLAPLGSIGLQAYGLLVVQAISLAIVAPLLLALARRHGATGWLAAMPSALWLLSPVVIKVNLFDYHPDTLLPALLVGAVLALECRRQRLFILLIVLALGVKEDAGFTVAALGVVLAWTGRRRLGTTVAVAAAAWSTLLMFVVMPHHNSLVRDNYSELFAGARGSSFADVLVYAVRHPLDTVASTLTTDKLGILVLLVATTGGLCLFAARWMLVAAPVTAVNLLSAYEPQGSLEYHYWIVPVAGLALAGAIGAGRVPVAWRLAWLRGAVVTAVLLTMLSLDAMSTTIAELRHAWPDRAARAAIVDAVPDGAAVSVPEYYFGPLSGRRSLYAIPEPFEPFALASKWGPTERAAALAGLDAVVDDAALRERLSAATLERNGFRPAVRRGDVTLFLR
jgi:uncharacterized membrane protein